VFKFVHSGGVSAFCVIFSVTYKVMLIFPCNKEAVPLHAMQALRGRGDIAPTHS
jgi:hypothetical protein